MVKINLVGFKSLQDKIAKAPAEIQTKVGREIDRSALLFQERAMKDAPKDVGFLEGEITVRKISQLTSEVISGSAYSAYMEFGTKGKFRPQVGVDASVYKGQTGGTFKTMLANLTNWVHRKGIGGKNEKQTAYLIARSILKNGVRPHPFFFKQMIPIRRELVERLIKVLKTAV